jgi:hypothetical protein
MSNKELILKRLLEEKHISIDEMFILNEKEISQPTTVVIKDLNPYPIWQQPHTLNPFWYSTGTSHIKPTELKSTSPSDYKMD